MDNNAKIIHSMLNQINVGSVFTVEDHIKAKLEIKANI